VTTYRLPLKRGELAQLVAEARTPAPLTLVVPMPPNFSNRRGRASTHWRVIHREKLEYWAQLDTLATLHRFGADQTPYHIPRPPTAPFARATLSSEMVLHGHMDDTNAAGRHKWLEDWLVARGYLASDRRTCVRWAAFPTQRVTRKEPARITLTLTPVTEQAS
jgi:hypothetical protein